MMVVFGCVDYWGGCSCCSWKFYIEWLVKPNGKIYCLSKTSIGIVAVFVDFNAHTRTLFLQTLNTNQNFLFHRNFQKMFFHAVTQNAPQSSRSHLALFFCAVFHFFWAYSTWHKLYYMSNLSILAAAVLFNGRNLIKIFLRIFSSFSLKSSSRRGENSGRSINIGTDTLNEIQKVYKRIYIKSK